MNVQQLLQLLEINSQLSLRFLLPSGDFVPDHFHVTEVGRIEKRFIDCGGTRRESVSCSLQLWSAHDVDHRLTVGKLAKILKLSEPVLETVDLPVEVEYGTSVAAQYILSDVEIMSQGLILHLVGKLTDCLARDKCGVNECSSSGCCC